MTPSQPTDQQTLFIEKGAKQYEILIGETTDSIVLMGIRDAITREMVDDPSVITPDDVREALDLLQWAFGNDPEVADGPQPITRLFIEEATQSGARQFEVVVGQTKEHQLVPLGIRDAISRGELCEDEMPTMQRFADAVKMWAWASAHDPDNPNGALNINFVDNGEGDG